MFVISSTASLACLVTKLTLLIRNFRQRNFAPSSRNRFVTIGGVQVSAGGEGDVEAAKILKAKYEDYYVVGARYACYILVAVFEDVPMGKCSASGS